MYTFTNGRIVNFMKKIEKSQPIRFVFWGAVTVLFNLILYYFIYTVLEINYQAANIISWFLTVSFSYIINKKFVFDSESIISIKEVSLFFGSRVFSLVLEILALWILFDIFQVEITISKLFSHAIALILNYYLSKFLFFTK